MSPLMQRLCHAFAVDPPGPAEPAEAEREAVEWFCRQVAKRRLTTPGLIALELARPLNYITSQAMQFIAPGVWSIARARTYEHYEQFANFLERRGSIEYLSRHIEELEHEAELVEKKARSGAEAKAPPQPRDEEEVKG